MPIASGSSIAFANHDVDGNRGMPLLGSDVIRAVWSPGLDLAA
jgi:hypothetical protein